MLFDATIQHGRPIAPVNKFKEKSRDVMMIGLLWTELVSTRLHYSHPHLILGSLSKWGLWATDDNLKWVVFLFNMFSHYHIFISLFSLVAMNSLKNVGEITVQVCEMFTLGFCPWLKNITCLSSLVIIIINEILNIPVAKVKLIIFLFCPFWLLVWCRKMDKAFTHHTVWVHFLLQFYGYLSQQQNMMQVQILLLSCFLFALLCYVPALRWTIVHSVFSFLFFCYFYIIRISSELRHIKEQCFRITQISRTR